MSAIFQRVAILGLGLLGGSLAMAARNTGAAVCTVGTGRRREPLERALREGVVDEIATPRDAVAGADLVVLACPVGAMETLLQSVSSSLSAGAIVTDVGSVKGNLADRLPALLPSGVHYVGSHPMAGSHLKGAANAREDLFVGAACAITPLPSSDPDAIDRIEAFWVALGARVVRRDPTAHDDDVAWTSHAPHVLAFAFALALERAPARAGQLAGAGFRDFTRIARSDAELWGDILSANRKALSGPLRDCADSLSRLAGAIEAGDTDTIERLLSAARDHLASLTCSEDFDAQRIDLHVGSECPTKQTALPRVGKTRSGHQEK